MAIPTGQPEDGSQPSIGYPKWSIDVANEQSDAGQYERDSITRDFNDLIKVSTSGMSDAQLQQMVNIRDGQGKYSDSAAQITAMHSNLQFNEGLSNE